MGDNFESYQLLATEIIKDAAKEYMLALKWQLKGMDKSVEIKEMENFFCSDWFKCISHLDGEYLIRKCKEKVMKRWRK